MRFLLLLYGLITLEVFAKNRPQNDYLLTLYKRHMKDAKQNGNSVHALLPSQVEDADDKTSTFHYNLSGLDRRDVITSLKLLININNRRPSTGQRAHLRRTPLAQTTSSSPSTFTSTSTSLTFTNSSTSTSPPSTTSSTSTSSPSTTSSTSTSPPTTTSSTSTSPPSTTSSSSTSPASTTSSTSTSPPSTTSSSSTSPPSTTSSTSTSPPSTTSSSSTSPPSTTSSSSTSPPSTTSSTSTSPPSTTSSSSTSPPSTTSSTSTSSTSNSSSSADRAARTGSPLLPLRARIHCLSHNTSTLVATVTVTRALSQCWQTVELMPHFAQLCQSARQPVTLTLQLQQLQHHQQHQQQQQQQRRASNGPLYRTVPRRFFRRHQVESYIVVITQDATATNLANKYNEISRAVDRRRFVDVNNNATSQRKIHLSDQYDQMTDRARAAHLSDLLRHSSARQHRIVKRTTDTKHYHYYRVDNNNNNNNNNNNSSSSSSGGEDDGREIVMTFKRFSQIEERNSMLRHSKKAHDDSMPNIPYFNDQHSTKWRNRLLPHPKKYRENLMKLKRRIHKRKYRIHPKYVDISRRRHLQNNPELLRNERLPSSWVDPVMKKLESSVLPPGGDNCSLHAPSSCTRQSFVVDFFELGWTNWIISPLSFDAFICMGNCSMPMQKDTTLSNHATLQTLKATFENIMNARTVPAQSRAHSMSRDPASESALPAAIPTPACVADQMEPLTLLYYDCHHSHVMLKTFPDMIISSCACR